MFGGVFLAFNWAAEGLPDPVDISIEDIFEPDPKDVPREEVVAKGLYLTGYSANNPKKRAEIIELIESTELNAVVVDVKDYTGYILYDRPEGEDGVWLSKSILDDPRAVVKDFQDHGIYVIARQTVFQDPIYAQTVPHVAVRSGEGLWRDYKGLAWVDASQQEVWEYNLKIAQHTIDLGFDEINFDYVRFPSDGNLAAAKFALDGRKKSEVMHDFFAFMYEHLKDEPAFISYDVFGLTMDNNDFDLNIGQRAQDILPYADFVSPMIYPSHYPNGYAGYDNPAANPYGVIKKTMTLGQQHMTTSTVAAYRPWLQAFNIGATYDAQKIRDQIRAVEEQPKNAGWLLWNARNVYSTKGLELAE